MENERKGKLKSLKRILSVIFIAAALLLSLALFAACNPEKGGNDTQKVSVIVHGGSITGTQENTGSFIKGSSVSITANVPSGKKFDCWKKGDVIVSTENPYVFNIQSDTVLNANFVGIDVVNYTVVVEGGVITGGELTSGRYKAGERVSVTASVNEGKLFDGWYGGAGGDSLISSDNPYTFTVSGDIKLIAKFTDAPPPVEVEKFSLKLTGGRITDSSDTEGEFDSGTRISVTADIPEDKNFDGWFKGVAPDQIKVSDNAVYEFTITEDTVLTAKLSDKPAVVKYTVNLSGGVFSGTDKNSGEFEENTEITINSTPPNGKRFLYWKNEGTQVSSVDPYTFKVTSDLNLTAEFEDAVSAAPIEYTLNVAGGKYDGQTSATVAEGSEVTVVADNKENGTFTGWFVNGESKGNSPTLTIKITKDTLVEGVFEMKYKLVVNRFGAEAAETTYYNEGETVTVTASDDPEGFVFLGWVSPLNAAVSEDKSYSFTISHDTELTEVYKKLPAPDGKTMTLIGCKAYTNGDYTQTYGDGYNVPDYLSGYYYIKADDVPGMTLIGIFKKSGTAEPVMLPGGAQPYPEVFNQTYDGDLIFYALYSRNFSVSVSGGAFEDETAQKSVGEYESVTVTAEQTADKTFRYWIMNGEIVARSTPTQSFIISSDTSLTAVFSYKYTVTVTGGGFKDNSGSEMTISSGDTVTVIPEADTDNKKFAGWYIGDELVSTDREYRFKVTGNIAVRASYNYFYKVSVINGSVNGVSSGVFKNGAQVLISADPMSGKAFAYWRVNGAVNDVYSGSVNIIVDKDLVFEAVYAECYTVSVGGDFVSVDGKSSSTVASGGKVTLSSPERQGYAFKGWSADGVVINVSSATHSGGNYTIAYTVNKDVSVSAIYVKTYTVTVIGGTGGGVYEENQIVTITAAEEENLKRFIEWISSDSKKYASDPLSYKVTGDVTLTAVFADLYKIEISGGSISGGKFDGASVGYFAAGDKVTVKASSSEGSRFDKWVGSDSTEFITEEFEFTVSGAVNYTQARVNQFTVTITNNVTSQAEKIKTYDEGARVTVSSDVIPSEDKSFYRWIDGEGVTYAEDPLIIEAIDKNWTLTAEFNYIYVVTIENYDGSGVSKKELKVVDGESAKITFSRASFVPEALDFLGWRVNGAETLENKVTLDLIVTSDMTAEAVMEPVYSQTSVLGYTNSENVLYSYPNISGQAASSFILPGLSAGENVVTLGIDYSETTDHMFIVGYIEPVNPLGIPNTMLFVFDMKQDAPDMTSVNKRGKLIKEIFLMNTDGSAFTGKAGLTVTEKNIYISHNYELLRIPLETIVNAKSSAFVKFAESISVPVKASYASYADNILWVGEYAAADDPVYAPDPSHSADGYTAWTVGYKVDEKGQNDAYDPDNGFALSALRNGVMTPDYVLRHGNDVQGIAVAGDKIVLSLSGGRTEDSIISVFKNEVYDPTNGVGNPMANTNKRDKYGDVTVNGSAVPYWDIAGSAVTATFTVPPMTKGIAVFKDNKTQASPRYKIYIAGAAGSNLYLNGTDGNGKSSNAVDCVWTLNIKQIS